jgi:hypothetical protein
VPATVRVVVTFPGSAGVALAYVEGRRAIVRVDERFTRLWERAGQVCVRRSAGCPYLHWKYAAAALRFRSACRAGRDIISYVITGTCRAARATLLVDFFADPTTGAVLTLLRWIDHRRGPPIPTRSGRSRCETFRKHLQSGYIPSSPRWSWSRRSTQ